MIYHLVNLSNARVNRSSKLKLVSLNYIPLSENTYRVSTKTFFETFNRMDSNLKDVFLHIIQKNEARIGYFAGPRVSRAAINTLVR